MVRMHEVVAPRVTCCSFLSLSSCVSGPLVVDYGALILFKPKYSKAVWLWWVYLVVVVVKGKFYVKRL